MDAKLIAALPSHSPSPGYGRTQPPSASDGSLPILIGFVITSAIAISIYILKSKQLQQYSIGFKSRPKIPCSHCRYFSHNPYLQCSIHPATVMTQKAVDCLDYSPNTQKKSVEDQSIKSHLN